MQNCTLKLTLSNHHFTSLECLTSASVHEIQLSDAVYLTKICERDTFEWYHTCIQTTYTYVAIHNCLHIHMVINLTWCSAYHCDDFLYVFITQHYLISIIHINSNRVSHSRIKSSHSKGTVSITSHYNIITLIGT